MRSDLYFRISVIDAGLQVKSHLGKYDGITVADAMRQLRAGSVLYSSLDYEAAASLIQNHGISLFYPSPNRIEELRKTILKMAVRLRPFWATVSPFGRERVSAVISSDQAQCLRYAALLGSTEPEVRRWWDQLASHFRAEASDRLLEIGRNGEELSLRFEKARLQRIGVEEDPRWVSLEDNLAGYDILSYRKSHAGNISEVFIEVKATTSADLCFVLSRREWDFAQNAGPAAEFHFWYLPEKKIRIADVNEISSSVPTDHGYGTWREALLNLSGKTFEVTGFND